MTRNCILCGKPVKPIKHPWYWYLWHVEGLPRHPHEGPEAEACYRDFQLRIGIKDPKPLPPT